MLEWCNEFTVNLLAEQWEYLGNTLAMVDVHTRCMFCIQFEVICRTLIQEAICTIILV